MQYKDMATILTTKMILILKMPAVIERISKVTPRKIPQAIFSVRLEDAQMYRQVMAG
jgi:hypothetical protein